MAQAFVNRVGQATASAAGTTLVVTVGAAGAAQGNKLVVFFGCNDDGNGAQPAVSDNKGNIYTPELDQTFVTNGNKRLIQYSSILAVALVNTDTITVTSGSLTRRVMDVLQFSGMGAAKDRVQGQVFSTSAVPSTGVTQQRRLANEVLVAGFLWIFSSAGDLLTAGAGFLAANTVEAAGGATNMELGTEYQIMSAIGTEAGTGTIPGNRGWIASMVGYCEPGVSFGQAPVAASAEVADIVGID